MPYNEARYGSNNIAQSDGYWNYVKDTAHRVVQRTERRRQVRRRDRHVPQAVRQVATATTSTSDGNFNEPDGYIDHFQAIHAGEGEEAGGGAQGADAIWSHRWYAFRPTRQDRPGGNKRGGAPIGDSGIWIGDYTTEPENGGLGVFSHEFGHDLGLPDLYDTAGGDNGTGFWTLMSARLVAQPRDDASAPRPATWARGRSCSSAGSTTRSCRSARTPRSTLGPAGQDVRPTRRPSS